MNRIIILTTILLSSFLTIELAHAECILGDQKYSQGIKFAVDKDSSYYCNDGGVWKLESSELVEHSACMYEGKLYGQGAIIVPRYNLAIKCGITKKWVEVKP